ncbi:MAG: aldehyde:ferredoxin oxidoreductase [Planctomycetota bacterium]|nr:MAG: aldehyde:ferredoxin oxidoreductase [Planctomycetota bacterium]
MAGYGAIVIRGASDLPVYVSIHGEKVRFHDATTLWGMGSAFTAGRIIRENETGAGLRTIMRIGKAGENLVTYSAVTCETYRHFGRLGLGAVFGSKKLKALVVAGKRSLPVADRKLYRRLYDRIYDEATNSAVMKKYHDLGTAENVAPLNAMSGLPTRNLTASRFEHAQSISGEAMAENYLGRRIACSHCPVACIHIAALREPCEDEPYFYKTSMISYDYETLYALGSMLGIGDPEGYLRLVDTIEHSALDAMTAGVALAWATEAFEKKLISTAETDGLTLAWGDADTYCEAARRIVSQPTEFYRLLARGVDAAAEKYGGTDFALTYGRNEMPGYHTGPASHLGFLVGTRHSHLDNAGYSLDQKVLVKGLLPPAETARKIVNEEVRRQILSSLVMCFFARGIYDDDLVRDCLASVGIDRDAEALETIGRRIYAEKYAYKFREGFSLDRLHIPKRILETVSPVKDWDEAYLRATIAEVGKLIDEASATTKA